MANSYDVVIIGGGPAGLSAGLYTSRDRLSSLLIERGLIGGLINETERLDNYPGFPDGIGGSELTQLMHRQATDHGLETVTAEATGLEIMDGSKIVKTGQGDFSARAVIIAGGSQRQLLGAPGEREFAGRGVSYCATCDAPFFSGKTIAVVGGGNAAVYEALHLAKFASKVFLIHRRGQLRATAVVQEKALAQPNIQILWSSVVEAIKGSNSVEKLALRRTDNDQRSSLAVDGIFIAIGLKPNTAYLQDILLLDKQGAIVVNENMQTSVAGILAAGDIRSGSIRQVVSAAGDGATAAIYAKLFIES